MTRNLVRQRSWGCDRRRRLFDGTDGRRAVSGSWDKTLRVWDLESGACLGVYVAAAPILSIALARGGNTIFAGTNTGATLRLDIHGIEPGPDL